MTATATGPTEIGDLVRVSICVRGRSTDLVLPSRLPVAQLLPDIVSGVGVLDTYDVYAGYTLVVGAGLPMDPDLSLMAQGVAHGSVLSLVPQADLELPTLYDDLAEAVADTVDSLGPPWSRASTRIATLTVAVVLLGLGAAVLLQTALGQTVLWQQRGSGLAVPAVAVAAAAALLGGATYFARATRDLTTATVLVVAADVYAGVAGLTSPSGDLAGRPAILVGVAIAAAGLVGSWLLPRRPWVTTPPVVLGAIAVGAGVTHLLTGIDAPHLAAVVLVVVVVVSGLAPRLALAASRDLSPTPPSEHDVESAVETARVRRAVESAQQLLRSVAVTVGLVLTLAAPVVVRLGWAGLPLVCAAGLAVLLRARRCRLGRDVAIGLYGGALGVASGVISALLLSPTGAPVIGAVAAVGAAAALVGLALPTSGGWRWNRLLDVAERLTLTALAPLLVLALGFVPRW